MNWSSFGIDAKLLRLHAPHSLRLRALLPVLEANRNKTSFPAMVTQVNRLLAELTAAAKRKAEADGERERSSQLLF